MVLAYLQQFGEATRGELDALLMDKLSDVLNNRQKRDAVNNLIQGMKREGLVEVSGTRRWAQWRIRK